jgi:hypothetical protein
VLRQRSPLASAYGQADSSEGSVTTTLETATSAANI